MSFKSTPIVFPEVFKNNKLINSMKDDPFWTLSDKNKRPIHAPQFLAEGVVRNASFNDGSPMVTLDELDVDPNLQAVNRAYRLRARDNHIICIDVEPQAPDSMIQNALNFPAHYTEFSTNGGVHLLIKVPDECITDEVMYMFNELNVFKEPVEKGEDREAFYEVLFNDHFITFTKKMLTDKPTSDFVNNKDDKEWLDGFLANIVKEDKDRKLKREQIKQFKIEMLDSQIDPDTKQIIDTFINERPFDKAKEQALLKTPKEFGGDMSRFEMSVASGYATHVIRTHKLMLETRSFRDEMLKLDEQSLVYAIYILIEDSLPYRDKHEEDRDGLPWLMYIAKNSYEFVKSRK